MDDEEDADADQQGIWPIEVSGKACRDARAVHRTTHQTEFELVLSGTASGQSILPPQRILSDLADLMFPGYIVARHPDARMGVSLLSDLRADLIVPRYQLARQRVVFLNVYVCTGRWRPPAAQQQTFFYKALRGICGTVKAASGELAGRL